MPCRTTRTARSYGWCATWHTSRDWRPTRGSSRAPTASSSSNRARGRPARWLGGGLRPPSEASPQIRCAGEAGARSARPVARRSYLEVHHLGGVLVDVLDPAMRDGRGLHRRHEVAPPQGRTRGVELLVGRLVVLQGVHLGEVVATGDLAEQGDQGLGRVLAVSVLLRQRRRLLHLVGRPP